MTHKLGQISKIQPDQIKILYPSLRISSQLPACIVNGGGDSIWDGRISNPEKLMTLTLEWVKLHTIVHHALTSTYTPNFIKIKDTYCGRQTDGQMDIWDRFNLVDSVEELT